MSDQSRALASLGDLAERRLEIYKRELELRNEVADIKIKMQQVALANGLSLKEVTVCW